MGTQLLVGGNDVDVLIATSHSYRGWSFLVSSFFMAVVAIAVFLILVIGELTHLVHARF